MERHLNVGTVRNRLIDVEGFVIETKERQEEMDHFNPDTTIIADNIPYQEDEDLTKKVETMIHRDLALP